MTMAGVDVQALPLYLSTAGGWERVRSNDRRQIWHHVSGARIFVPNQAGSDFPALIDEAVQQIAGIERRDAEDVEVDLTWFMYDTLHVRRIGADHGLALEDGLEFHQGIRDLVLSAAQASRTRRPIHSGRRPIDVGNYLDRVRLIPATEGSYVAHALLPLALDDEQSPLPTVVPVSDDARAVSTTVLESTEAAVRTASQVAAGAPLADWDEAIAQGVSANLCEAMSRLLGERDEANDVELIIRWTWAAPRLDSSAITVPVHLRQQLEQGRDYLTPGLEADRITMAGRVTRLRREAMVGPGQVTVKGVIEGSGPATRTIAFELDEATYGEAIRAHEDGRLVHVKAQVETSPGRRTEVRSVEDFRVVSDSA